MKIAILNESFLKDRHIQRLKMLGEVVQYTDTVDEHTTIERLEGVDIAVADCWLTQLNETLFSQAPQLKFVSLNSTGYDQVDLAAATRHKVAIANVPGFSTEGVAEHAIALMFAAVRHITAGTIAMHPQPFQVDPSNAENASAYLGMTLRDKTMGVIGFGKIGSRVAELAQGLGMKVVAYNRTAKEAPGVTFVSLNELLQQSDVVSLNSALSEDLVNIIDAKALELMKPTAYIINTARGEMIDEAALANALDENRIAGAGLDLLADWTANNPLLNAKNVVLTPHIAYLTTESLNNMADIITENIEHFVKGEKPNVLNEF